MRKNLAWVALALGSIWIAVTVISLTSPDLVYGADRNTFPLIPAVTWMSGAAASSYVLRALVTRHPTPDDQRHAWVGIALSALAIWALVTFVILLLPTFDFEIIDKVVQDKDGVLLEWYWWKLIGTEVEGAAVIKTTDEGVVFERLSYYKTPWPLRD